MKAPRTLAFFASEEQKEAKEAKANEKQNARELKAIEKQAAKDAKAIAKQDAKDAKAASKAAAPSRRKRCAPEGASASTAQRAAESAGPKKKQTKLISLG